MRILIINGANLGHIGEREPDVYGTTTMDEIINDIKMEFIEYEISYLQSNHEGELIDIIEVQNYDALIINPGAFTHYSYALADCLKNIKKNKIEVHISNIYNREEFRKKSVTAPYTDGIISGFGILGYKLAVKSLEYKK